MKPNNLTPTQELQNFITAANWPKALSRARRFFFGIPPDDMRNIEIAADCLNGKTSFYQSMGIDTNAAIGKAKAFIISKYALQ